MITHKEYLYQGHVIKLQFRNETPSCDAGWSWEVFKDGEDVADNSKQCPDWPLHSALHYAKEAIDNRDETIEDYDKWPVCVVGCEEETDS